jgi:hypothetical protein
MPRWKMLVVLVMSLWLPLQGMAAVTMPFCKHSMTAAAADAHAVEHPVAHGGQTAHHHDAHHAQMTHGAGHDATQSLAACDDCGQCALSCAFTLPVAGLQATSLLTAAAPHSIATAFADVVPHRLNRPPPLLA